MKTYVLKRQEDDVDVISKVRCENFDDACEYFAEIKKLPIEELLKIYVIVLS